MTAESDDAICLRWWDWSETSQTVSLLTRTHGLIRGLAKGAKRERSAFCGGIEMLTRGEVVFTSKPSRQLHTLTAWSLSEVFPGPRRTLAGFHSAMLAADVVLRMLSEGDPHPETFEAMIGFLRELGVAGDHWNALSRVLLRTLRDCGFRPELNVHARTREDLGEGEVLGFDPRLGGTVSSPSEGSEAGVWRVRRETIEYLRRLDREEQTGDGDGTGIGDANGGSDSETAQRASKLLASYIREVLGADPPTFAFLLGEPRGNTGP